MMSNAECSEHGLQRKPKCKTCVYIKTHHDTTSTVATEGAAKPLDADRLLNMTIKLGDEIAVLRAEVARLRPIERRAKSVLEQEAIGDELTRQQFLSEFETARYILTGSANG